MTLHPRRPPGHANRKALAYAADILTLRLQGHSLAAIREALEDAGTVVSISTVRREALRTAPPGHVALARRPLALETLVHGAGPIGPITPSPHRVNPALPSLDQMSGPSPLPGKALAEEFMSKRSFNPLHTEAPSK